MAEITIGPKHKLSLYNGSIFYAKPFVCVQLWQSYCWIKQDEAEWDVSSYFVCSGLKMVAPSRNHFDYTGIKIEASPRYQTNQRLRFNDLGLFLLAVGLV